LKAERHEENKKQGPSQAKSETPSPEVDSIRQIIDHKKKDKAKKTILAVVVRVPPCDRSRRKHP
jgi:hypothetical protein